jgi:hypothetical protein
MATVSTPIQPETAEETFQRLLQESEGMNPESVGTPEEIKRDALATFHSWSKLRRRAKSA